MANAVDVVRRARGGFRSIRVVHLLATNPTAPFLALDPSSMRRVPDWAWIDPSAPHGERRPRGLLAVRVRVRTDPRARVVRTLYLVEIGERRPPTSRSEGRRFSGLIFELGGYRLSPGCADWRPGPSARAGARADPPAGCAFHATVVRITVRRPSGRCRGPCAAGRRSVPVAPRLDDRA